MNGCPLCELRQENGFPNYVAGECCQVTCCQVENLGDEIGWTCL